MFLANTKTKQKTKHIYTEQQHVFINTMKQAEEDQFNH